MSSERLATWAAFRTELEQIFREFGRPLWPPRWTLEDFAQENQGEKEAKEETTRRRVSAGSVARLVALPKT
eukprot:10423204-Karenia_brevis.AAC.1